MSADPLARMMTYDEQVAAGLIDDGTLPDARSGSAHVRHPIESADPVLPPGSERGPEVRRTDVGNGRRLVAGFGARFRWVPDFGKFIVYDGTRWVTDSRGEVVEFAKATVAAELERAVQVDDREEKKAAVGWAIASENANRLDAMIRLARSEPGIAVTADELDSDPWLLNVRNGTLDLRTGRIAPHDPGDLITKRAEVIFDPDAPCPTWSTFLEHVLPDPEVRSYVQRAVGVSLVGKVIEHVLFVLYGSGANGKSTFSNMVQRVLGDYAKQAAVDVLVAGDSHPTGVADLQGARFVLASELDEGRRLAEGVVKGLTGGDIVKARYMRQDFFEFAPSHTVWLATNHRPIIAGTDYGIWRRVKLVPFLTTIAEADQDQGLGATLEAEAAGVLNWALEGCRDWQRAKLRDPDAVVAAVANYRAEMDSVGAFVDECCVVHPEARIAATDLRPLYEQWCDENGERPLNGKRLGASLTERGFDRKRYGQTRRWFWFGLGQEVNP